MPFLLFALPSCGADSHHLVFDEDAGADVDVDVDVDADADADADADTDSDTSSDTETDTGGDTWTGGMIEFEVNVHTAHPYEDDWSQNWTINPPGPTASAIELYVANFDLEACCDHLYVYDRVGGTLLDQFEGSGLGAFTAGPYYAPTLYLSFTTDFSVVGNGFDIDRGGYMP